MHKDYRDILKDCGVKSKDFANKLGITYDSYRSMVARGTPKWIKSFEFGFFLGEKMSSEKNDPSGK